MMFMCTTNLKTTPETAHKNYKLILVYIENKGS